MGFNSGFKGLIYVADIHFFVHKSHKRCTGQWQSTVRCKKCSCGDRERSGTLHSVFHISKKQFLPSRSSTHCALWRKAAHHVHSAHTERQWSVLSTGTR